MLAIGPLQLSTVCQGFHSLPALLAQLLIVHAKARRKNAAYRQQTQWPIVETKNALSWLTQNVIRFIKGYVKTRASDAAPTTLLKSFSCRRTPSPRSNWPPSSPAVKAHVLMSRTQMILCILQLIYTYQPKIEHQEVGWDLPMPWATDKLPLAKGRLLVLSTLLSRS